jgi:hypothetical protein
MANYFYVKDTGTLAATADTSYTSLQTGAFPANANVYGDIKDAIDTGKTTPPVDGDFIIISDSAAATFANTADTDLNGGGTPGGAGLQFISVDDANCENYKPGASQEKTTTNRSIFLANSGLIAGVSIIAGQNIRPGPDGRFWRIIDSTLKCGSNSHGIDLNNTDAIYLELINSDLDLSADSTGVGNNININNGSKLVMHGGKVIHNTGLTESKLFSVGGDSGGMFADFYGVDLTDIDTLIDGITNVGTTDLVLCRFFHCKMNTTFTVFGDAALLPSWRAELYGSDDATSDLQHRIHIEDGAGKAVNNDGVYVTAMETWLEGTVKSSVEVTTTSLCSHVHPFNFELLGQYVDLGDTASDKIEIDIVTDSGALSLTDTDIAFFLMYPDGTTKIQANFLSTGKSVGTGNFGTDPLAAGTALPNVGGLSGADWTGEPGAANFYRVVLDTSGDAGEGAAIGIRVEIYKPNIVAGDLFIHPLLTTS